MPFARLGAVFGFLAVTLGAFGAHALRDRLGAALSQVYETGVRYQMYHALALIAVDLMRARSGAERGHGAPGGAEPAGGAAPSATAASGTTTDRIGSAEPRRARSPLEVAGTTVDPVDSLVEVDGEVWQFVDTAGLRKRVGQASGTEYYASLRTKALVIANAAVMPPRVSATGYPARSGAQRSSPVMLIAPDRPWTIWS